MKDKFLFYASVIALLALTCILLVISFSNKSGRPVMNSQLNSYTQSDLNRVLREGWNQYKKDKPNFNGVLAMQIISPKGNYFLTTGEVPVKNTDHIRIASISKTFTAAGIMLLNQKGWLNIDDKIIDNIPGTNTPYVPDTADYALPYKNDITIRMLLMHRAGIFDLTNNPVPVNKYCRRQPYAGESYLDYQEKIDPNHTFTFDELLGVNSKCRLSFFEPGSAYHYSDIGYSLLGKIIERVSGLTYADFIQQQLLTPKGLNNTRVVYQGDDQMLPNPYVKGYDWANGEFAEVTKSNMSPHVAEGSMYSTAYDLALWGHKLFGGQTGLNQQTVEMMMAGRDRGAGNGSTYGLGLGSSPDITGVGHSGAHEGYLTNMVYNPKTGVTIALFTNTWDLSQGLESIKTELITMSAIATSVLARLGY